MWSQHLRNKLVERFPWAKSVNISMGEGWFQLIWDMLVELDQSSANTEILAIDESYGKMVVLYRSSIISKY
ncbi:hypothetical protein J41TS12_37190 [Paenibacillus antibioticophila]|uniref:Uncharacterized protein n=1 Tax=Paenibacillus antibioticophila TaxID=1274374 RepID=A0A919XWD9_9BACL|nr:hypothetical protein J41TS12_37190 [Paenibacillus antibioticophila]